LIGDLRKPDVLRPLERGEQTRGLPELSIETYRTEVRKELGLQRALLTGPSGGSSWIGQVHVGEKALDEFANALKAWEKDGRPDARGNGDVPKTLFSVVSAIEALGKAYSNRSMARAFIEDEASRSKIRAQLERARTLICGLDGVHGLGDQLETMTSAIASLNGFSDAMGLGSRVLMEQIFIGNRSSASDAGVLFAGQQTLRPLSRFEFRVEWDDPAKFVELSSAQAAALKALGTQPNEHAERLLLFTDPNKDPDDLALLLQLRELRDRGFVRVDGAILTTLGSYEVRMERARFAKGAMNWMGLNDAAIGVGANYPMFNKDDEAKAAGIPGIIKAADHVKFLPGGKTLLAPSREISANGLEMAIQMLRRAPDKSINMVITAGMTDAAALLLAASNYRPPAEWGELEWLKSPAYPDSVNNRFLQTLSERDRDELRQLFQSKVKRVSVMGAIAPEPDGQGFVAPAIGAYNNMTDYRASQVLYQGVQALGIELNVLDKSAAYTAAVSPDFYDGIAKTNLPPAVYLKDMQYEALSGLFSAIADGHIPNLTFEWFFKQFTGLKWDDPKDRAIIDRLLPQEGRSPEFSEVWRNVTRLNLYDPMALMAGIVRASQLLYQPSARGTDASPVNLIGGEEVKDPRGPENLLGALAICSTRRKPEAVRA
jgi:hypothetical protein